MPRMCYFQPVCCLFPSYALRLAVAPISIQLNPNPFLCHKLQMTSPDTAATTIEIKRIEIESIAREGSPQCDIWYDTVAGQHTSPLWRECWYRSRLGTPPHNPSICSNHRQHFTSRAEGWPKYNISMASAWDRGN